MLKFKFGMVQIVLFALLGSVLKFVNGQAFSASSQSGPSHSPLQGFGNQYGSANWISTDSFSVNNGQCQNLNPLFLNDQQRGEWIQVAFNGPILVQCFEVFCGQFVNGIPQSYYSGCPQKIYMYGSNDGVNYTLLATYTPVTLSSSGSAASRGWELFPFLNSGMVSYQTYALKIAQIEIGAGSVGQQSAIITSLRYQVGTYAIAKVSASTSWPDLSFGPGYAFDGRPDTIWGSQSGNYNLSGDYIGTNSVEGYLGESLTVEFTAPIVVTSFNIWTRQCCLPNNPTDFSLYGFAAGTKKKIFVATLHRSYWLDCRRLPNI